MWFMMSVYQEADVTTFGLNLVFLTFSVHFTALQVRSVSMCITGVA